VDLQQAAHYVVTVEFKWFKTPLRSATLHKLPTLLLDADHRNAL
jgi:hypothetical protein